MKRVHVCVVWMLVAWLVGGFATGMLAADKPAPAGGKMVSINTAGSEQLETLPRIGPKIAQRIIEFRKANGPFKKTADLMKVKGIGAKLFEKIQPLVTL